MTEKEARLILDVRISRFDHANDVNIALEIAKNAIDEIQQYRNLGKIEFLTNMKSNYVEVLSDLRQYQKLGTVEECKKSADVRKRVTEIVNRQLVAGKDNYKETYDCFWKIVKVIQDNY